ncbi:hypothetical protein ACYOEI_03855 [Singulisphaera rosea]
MPENLALYSRSLDKLPQAQMAALADQIAPKLERSQRGTTHTYVWSDMTIVVSEMPGAKLSEHLRGFEGYVFQHIYKNKPPERGLQIIRSIRETRLVVGVEIRPGRDVQGRAEEFVGRMCGGLRPFIFYEDAVFDWMFRLLCAPDGSFDPEADLE